MAAMVSWRCMRGGKCPDLRPLGYAQVMWTLDKHRYDKLPYPTIVVVGGGFAGLEFIQRLAGKPYKVLLLDKQNHHCFQPLLYQVATASLGADSIGHPFRRTVGPMPNAAFRMAEVLRVVPERKRVETNVGDFHQMNPAATPKPSTNVNTGSHVISVSYASRENDRARTSANA